MTRSSSIWRFGPDPLLTEAQLKWNTGEPVSLEQACASGVGAAVQKRTAGLCAYWDRQPRTGLLNSCCQHRPFVRERQVWICGVKIVQFVGNHCKRNFPRRRSLAPVVSTSGRASAAMKAAVKKPAGRNSAGGPTTIRTIRSLRFLRHKSQPDSLTDRVVQSLECHVIRQSATLLARQAGNNGERNQTTGASFLVLPGATDRRIRR